MIYSEKQYKELKAKYEQELLRLKKENEIKDKEVKILKQQNKQKDEVIQDLDKNNYKSQCETLRIENAELKKKLKIYEEKFALSRISLEKNSSNSCNSCKPSSTNGFKKVIQNNRVKSGRRPGREKGHERSAPTVTTQADEIVHVSKIGTCSCGCKTIEKEEIARDLITLEIRTHVKQYVGKKTICPKCNKEYLPNFPTNVKSIINYDEGIKTLVVYLSSYCNVPNQKVTELLGLLSDGKIKMCQGTVGETMKQFSKKSKPSIEKIKRNILKAPVINEDETPITVNGKIMSSIGVFTKEVSLVDAFENRKLESFQEMGILDRYIGTVCHGHNSIHTSFVQSKQDVWDQEHLNKAKKDKPKYYDSERCLKTRLREYVDDHLRFITDFRIDFTNNLAERGLRKIKTKIKIAGGFRNLKNSKYYCNAISIIDTCKKQNMNIGETIKNIFMGQKKIFAF